MEDGMGWAGHAARMGIKRNAYRIMVRNITRQKSARKSKV
jgi:hypothetical protein